jgi:hypothetical protein
MPVESVTFAWDGVDTVTATISNPQVGETYEMLGLNTLASEVAGVGDLVLFLDDNTGLTPGEPWDIRVRRGDYFNVASEYMGAIVLEEGNALTAYEGGPTVTWSYDGANVVTAAFTGEIGTNYSLYVVGVPSGSANDTANAGTGSPMTLTADLSPFPWTGDYFLARLVADPTTQLEVRLFEEGVSGTGTVSAFDAGGDLEDPLAGVRIAFDDTLLEPNPTWTRIDTEVKVARWEIRRGRQGELEKTGTAEATVYVNDTEGLLDAANAGSPWFGKLDGKQIRLSRWNPVAEEWQVRFRGYIEGYAYNLPGSQVKTEVQIRCVGFMDYLATAEMAPGQAGTTPPAGSEGNIFYEDAEIDDRILAILADANFPTALSVVFSGNVVVQETIYDPGYTFLAALQDAADAEFPGVSNVYEDRFGRIVFHGRHARFDPDTVALEAGTAAWDFQRWKAGDASAIALEADTAQVRPPLSYDRDLKLVINAALITPLGIDETAIAAQLSVDLTSIGKYGVRSWSAADLRILEHKTNGNDALEETKLMADYYKTNYSEPRTRPRQITFKPLLPTDVRAEATWALMCGVDISDVVSVLVAAPGGGGLDLECYVEGITETCYPGPPEFGFGEVTLDVSPTAWYETDVFADS